MREIISEVRYNWANAAPKSRKDIQEGIKTRIAGPDAARFLFQGRQNGDILYCQEAFQCEVDGEIASELRSYFNLTPTDRDYIFGVGAIAQWTGNVFYRKRLMDPRQLEYSAASSAQKGAIVDEIYNAIKRNGGRFLYSWDSRPFQGVMEEPQKDHITTKLGNALREKKGNN